ncbi:MAG: small multi-drug export protein [Acidimicrobiia bacterium]|jgi:uncharacterized membrane protein
MTDTIRDWVQSLPIPEPVAVMLLAMVPIFELRGALPFARQILDMAPLPAFAWSVIGNAIPVPIILWLLPPFTGWAERHWGALHRLLDRLNASTERRHSARFERLRDVALVTFVAIPLPVTGAWSGSLAAVVFRVPKRRAIPLICLGIVIAGVIVTLLIEAFGWVL